MLRFRRFARISFQRDNVRKEAAVFAISRHIHLKLSAFRFLRLSPKILTSCMRHGRDDFDVSIRHELICGIYISSQKAFWHGQVHDYRASMARLAAAARRYRLIVAVESTLRRWRCFNFTI